LLGEGAASWGTAIKKSEAEKIGKAVTFGILFNRLRRGFSSQAAGVYLPEGRYPIIPFFQHSIIPVVSAAK
jgi:hypothetical protein